MYGFKLDRGRLREARREKRLTLEEAGEALGKTYNFVWSLERGKTKHVKGEDLFALASLYEIDPRELMIRR